LRRRRGRVHRRGGRLLGLSSDCVRRRSEDAERHEKRRDHDGPLVNLHRAFPPFAPAVPSLRGQTRTARGDTCRRVRASWGSRGSSGPTGRTLNFPKSTTYSICPLHYTDDRTTPTHAPSRSAARASTASGRNASMISCPSLHVPALPSGTPAPAAST